MKKSKFSKSGAVLLLALATLTSLAAQAGWRDWTITKTSWTATDERNYSDWVRTLGESGCTTVDKCLRSPKNYYANDEERASVRWYGDCGRFPYVLRAYFAWKNHLPFGYVNGVTTVDGSGDLRYSAKGNIVTSRAAITQRSASQPINGVSAVQNAVESVYTANYRYKPETDITSEGLFFDFSPVEVTRDQIRPGTAIYDPNGHVVVVYKVSDEGVVYFFDAHPDNSVSHSTYGEKFVRSSPGMGAGFKNFRPIRLAGAQQLSDGRLIGGRIATVPNDEVPGYSTEQFYGTDPVQGSWSKGKFVVKGQVLDYYDFVRTRLAVGDLKYNPLNELANGMDSLCQDLQDRVLAVQGAITNGIQNKSQPSNLPNNIYGTDGEWESFSTPSRDARLKTSFRELRKNTEKYIQMYNDRSPRIEYTGSNLIQDLRDLYAQKASACTVSYTNSNGRSVTLTYDQVASRLFKLDFDPYHCIERRWGATEGNEAASCEDGSTKSAWFEAEQRLRNQLDRTYDVRMGFDLGDLRSEVPGSGVSEAPDVDLKGFLDRQ